jgi:uncharacterized protein (DUF952 family)
VILHILKRAEWEAAAPRGSYAPITLTNEGFIHCSTVEQLVQTANLLFSRQHDLVIVCIDEKRLKSQLVYEAPASAGHESSDGPFPHLYGPLNLDAVTGVYEFPCDGEGMFELPAVLHRA